MGLMDLAQLLGNPVEFIGAITVVVTFAYLAVQIRQNTRATYAASHHAIANSLDHGNLDVATDPQLAEIWISDTRDCSY